jgi:TrmH family RNA methyltransferase
MAVECQKSDFEIDRVFVAESYAGENPFESELTVTVSDDVFRFLSDEKTPQGILCRVRIPTYALSAPKGKCLLLDGVADPGNVGTIIRTANAAGYEEIYLTETCADPYAPKSVRASMSGVFFTKLYRGEKAEILSVLAETPIVVADMGGVNVFDFEAPKRFALAIGNEANGISQEVENAAAYTVKIPMKATQESLNAAISAGIIMYVLNKDVFHE